jgi:hypothetical protein
MPTARCAHCGATFASSASRAKYCQQACYLAVVRQRGADGLIARFWAKVQTDGPIQRAELGPCWVWTASLIRGYGQFHLPRSGRTQRTVYAHRFAWTLTNGPIPEHLSVLHRCDHPVCVNPNHLFLGTQPDNLADARAKGRLIDGRHLLKVSDADVAYIRAHYRPRENSRELAAQFGISVVHVGRLARDGRPTRAAVGEVC